MTTPINYLLVDFVLQFYYCSLPQGVDSSMIASQCGIPGNLFGDIFSFLIGNKLIKKVENDDSKYIITKIGIEAVNMQIGIENYLRHQKKLNTI